MRFDHYTTFFSSRYDLEVLNQNEQDILEGRLKNKKTGQVFSIVNSIPRFISEGNHYASNFGIQWNRFKTIQLDSHSGLTLTHDRFWNNTKWLQDDIRGKWVLEAGSGAGRFTEVLLKAGARVVSCDMSNAVDANFANNNGKYSGELFLVQTDINELPFGDEVFDYVFCYGVLQHTFDANLTYRSLFKKVRPGGRISVDIYREYGRPRFWIHYKYSWRKITTRLSPKTLLRIIQLYMPVWLPVNILLRKIPWGLGDQILYFIPIPCWNYYGKLDLTYRAILKWAVLDTFDALGAAYDKPKTLEEVRVMVESDENKFSDIFYGSNGIVANVQKR